MARARSGTSDLTRTLAACPQPVYLLDSRRMVAYLNAACASWLGIDAEKLIGTRADYHSGADAGELQRIAAGLCPPVEAFSASHSSGSVTAIVAGEMQQRSAQFFALAVPDEPSPALLAILATGSEPLAAASEEPSAAELHVLLRWLRQTMASRPALGRWVGEAPAVRRVREQFEAASESRARVLVLGPRGSGREELARAIHYGQKPEAAAPLAAIDCALVDAESLQMSITSLVRQHAVSESLATPALMLMDVDRLSPAAQHELWGFLELPGFELRTLATAERSPVELADFDRRLAYALGTLVIELPPLSQRREELPLLVQSLVEELNAAGGKQVSGASPEALERLATYTWPGDVAQLADTIKEAWTSAAGPLISLADLPRWLGVAEQAAARPQRSETKIVLDEFLADIERELIVRALARGRGNKSKAARLLGISRPRLLRRIEQLKIAEPKSASES
jgi:transcriptional regulator with PAS, ATPase and Fis domain